MQTILGANGVIGNELAKILTTYTDRIRLVSRNPRKVNSDDEVYPADLTDAEKTIKAVEGSDVAYLTVGLQYKTEVWQTQWPVIMRNVINACEKFNVKLVFFDNVYLYGNVKGWMKEDTPTNPISRKGEIRAKIADMIMSEIRKGNLTALIARSADFYGPDTPLSFVDAMVFKRLRSGKKAQWMINDDLKHSFTFTPDAGKATAILGNSDKAYNQVWHLPTDKNVLTGRQFIELSAQFFGFEPKPVIVKKWMLKLIGIFNSVVKESIEMLYQYDSEYLFDSSKFENAFNYQPTKYEKGIEETVKSMI